MNRQQIQATKSEPSDEAFDHKGQNEPDNSFSQVIAGSVYRSASNDSELVAGSSYAVEHGNGPGLLDWVLDGAAYRKHREVMRHNQHVMVETMEAVNMTYLIATDLLANSLETEDTMEQIIKQHSASKLAMSVAAEYVQIARGIQMQTAAVIAQTGANRIKNKIERR